MNKKIIKVEIVSDVVCPWCYIGKRRFERAVDQLKDNFDFEVSWLPFELNPELDTQGTPHKEYLTSKFGGAERYDQLTGHVAAIALEEGLHFNYEKQKILPNTRDAHRLIRFATTEGKQALVKEALMKAYFTDGVDLSNKENLLTIAVAAGLDETRTQALLDSDEGTDEIILAEQRSRQRGVNGVPFFIVNDAYGISGAQATDVFVRSLQELADQQ
jgi:predicted DsbA family dithiol-disulfide isomerase